MTFRFGAPCCHCGRFSASRRNALASCPGSRRTAGVQRTMWRAADFDEVMLASYRKAYPAPINPAAAAR